MATKKNMIKNGDGNLVEVVDSTARELILKVKSKVESLSGTSQSNSTTTTYSDTTKSYDAEISSLKSQINQLKSDVQSIDTSDSGSGTTITIDETPTEDSENAVSSGGVYDAMHSDVISTSGSKSVSHTYESTLWTDTLPEGRWVIFLKAVFPWVDGDSPYHRTVAFGPTSSTTMLSRVAACTDEDTCVSATALVESTGGSYSFSVTWLDETNTTARTVKWVLTGFKIPAL